jgi:hypothetical protein
VGPDWAPYQNGQWVWEDYYGWTWVSADPWGWAPYHYGRWFWGAGGWAWYPGPVFAQPFWAPAYVGFFGFGGGLGLGVGFGFGGVGWVALAPFEVFHPWWGRGFYGGFGGGFLGNHTAIVNNVNIATSFRNARITGGAIGVNAAGFGRGGQISALNRSQLASGGLVHGVLPVAPDRSSLRFSNRAVSGRYPQARAQSFAGRMQAPRVAHTSFEQQQRGMQQMSRGNFSSPAGNSRISSGAGESAAHGWSHFGEPIHGTSGVASGASSYARGESQVNRSYSPSASSSRAGGAVRISPPIVQQRGYSGGSSSQAPRSFGGGARSAPSGGGHTSGGGGHHR